ncbi:MAG: hypothetical protein IH899_01250 [Planctomycetes bacterium]|nr:hypothetical protein [Planctomycetota bacterium]
MIHVGHEIIGAYSFNRVRRGLAQPFQHDLSGELTGTLQQPSVCWRSSRSFDLQTTGVLYERGIAGEWKSRLYAGWQHHEKTPLDAHNDLDHGGWELGIFLDVKHSFLPDLGQCLVGEWLGSGPGNQESLIIFVMKSQPFRIRNRARAKTAPVQLAVTNLNAADMLEKEKRDRALQPIL